MGILLVLCTVGWKIQTELDDISIGNKSQNLGDFIKKQINLLIMNRWSTCLTPLNALIPALREKANRIPNPNKDL